MNICGRIRIQILILAAFAAVGIHMNGQETQKKAEVTSKKSDGIDVEQTTMRSQQVLQKDLEALIGVSKDESKQLAAMQEALQKQDEDRPQNYLKRLEHILDSSLAGTLAGLALAAATFAVTFTVPISDKIKRIELDDGKPNKVDVDTLKKMKIAVGRLVMSFYVFVGFLVESLTLAQWAKPGGWLSQYAAAEWASVVLAGGGLVWGTVLLSLGAMSLKSIVLEPSEHVHSN